MGWHHSLLSRVSPSLLSARRTVYEVTFPLHTCTTCTLCISNADMEGGGGGGGGEDR